MADYRELANGYGLNLSEFGQKGARTFVDDPGNAGSLPSIGDAFSVSYPDCTLKTIDISKFGDHVDIEKFVCNYDSDEPADEALPVADLPRSLSVSGEFMKLDDGETATWDGTSDDVDRSRTKRITTVTLSIQVIYAAMSTLLTKVRGVLGRINDSSFEGIDAGLWLFSGCQASEFRNAGGAKKWKATMSFELRSVTAVVGANNDGWNFIWDKVAGAWKKTDPLIYEDADFSTLF